MDVWDAIASNTTSGRTELIHVAQPGSTPNGALRVGDWKLLVGNFQTGSGEWYLTPGQAFNSTDFTVKCGAPPSFLAGLAPAEGEPGFFAHEPLAGCNPSLKTCLFNIAEDPCEHVDRSDDQPEVLTMMLNKLLGYQSHSIRLSWASEEDRCLPKNLPSPNTGAERPCVGSAPELPPSPVPMPPSPAPAPPGPSPSPSPVPGFKEHAESYCGPSKSFYALSDDALAECSSKCTADGDGCHCFDWKAKAGDAAECSTSKASSCGCRLHKSSDSITSSGAGYSAFEKTAAEWELV